MINHIVLYKRKPDIAKRPDLEHSLVRCIRELGPKVPVVRGWKVSADSCLQHPAYIALVSILTTYFEWAACDYTL